jgi:hypothetical protein
MITKKFTAKNDIKNFEKQFVNGDIETDVIFNIVHDENKIAKHASLQQYHHLWNSYDLPHSGLSQILQSILVRHSNAALQYYFGKCDFIFDGNRDYKNYVLAFNGFTFIASSKPEVVLVKDIHFIKNVVDFENSYKQLILDYIVENPEKLSEHQKEKIVELETIGLIKDGKINTAYC